MLTLPAALAPLGAYRQFIVYVLVPSSRPGKTDKFPVDWRTGHVPPKGTGGAHDPAMWTDAASACATAARLGSNFGVGFVFTEADPFFFIDVDECLTPATETAPATWSPIVHELCGVLNGAAVEVSQSGRGLHIIGTGSAPAVRRKKDRSNKLFDLYTEARFVALTGANIIGDASTVHTAALHAITAKYLQLDAAETAQGWTTGPCAEWRGPADDAQLIERACRSQSAAAAFGNRATFADLWMGNVDVLAKAYPPDRVGDTYNASTADSALAQHLAFWTGKDCERIKRLMMQSALVRDKWIEREANYLEPTILNVCARQQDVLQDKPPEPLPGAPVLGTDEGTPAGPAPAPSLVTGNTFLNVPEQIDLFRGCIYVVDQNRALCKGGVLLKPEQFKAVFGGYTFVMDNTNDRTSRDAWEAFTQSQCYRAPRADSTTFRPERAPAEIIQEAGRTCANTWWPVEVPRQVGDPGPFLRHLEKLLPVERDRRILLSYMAACVQHKGIKFQWAPLLQGTPGNGKTFFTECVMEAIGDRYAHMPKADQLTNKFNSWMQGKVFIGVEDVYVPESKMEVMQALLPMITGRKLEIELKGVDQEMRRVCANFMLNTNPKDALRKTRDDRRLCVFYTAQQSAADIIRDGMGGDYFPNLYNWARREGYAIVAELLHTMPIDPEFNPGGTCHRAPETSTTEQAIGASMGSVEHSILEAVGEGEPGFMGGWVSSKFLDAMLQSKGLARRAPLGKRRELMASLGYDYHPALTDGRVNNSVFPDGGKPRLYLLLSHPARALTDPAEVAKAYSAAQGLTIGVPAK